MKKFLVFLLLILMFSCSNNGNNSQENNQEENQENITIENNSLSDSKKIIGIYKSQTTYKLEVEIKQSDLGYSYKLSYGNEEFVGNCVIDKTEEDLYVIFDGKIGKIEPKSICMLIKEDNAVIQNYGNANNEYCFFDKIDEKYIELKK